MKNVLEIIGEKLLMGPGPSMVPDSVYRALAKPTVGHLDPDFLQVMDEVKTLLGTVMDTRNRLTLPVSGTGSAGMEAAFVNLVEPGDSVLLLINGVFGRRMEDLAGRLGAKVDTLEFDWGAPVDPDAVKAKLDGGRYSLVAVVHAETSTGVRNPVEEIGRVVGERSEALYLVDAVTSLGGIPLHVDDWKIDAVYSGTQKCLSCPPGLAPLSFSDRAVKKLTGRATKVPNWYLDLSMIINYWDGSKRAYHHTAPINMIYALYESLRLILEEGLENAFERHARNHRRLIEGLEALGLQPLVSAEYRLPMLNAIRCPEGKDEAKIRTALLEKHRIEIGAGLGPLAGKIWRIGLMGHTARPENVDRLVGALRELLG